MQITTKEMEIAIADYFNVRRNVIIPNVYWSFFNHECDLIVLTNAGCVYEIEIKISLSNLKQDLLKRHGHRDHWNRIKRLYFAIPESLERGINYIPDDAGILVVSKRNKIYKSETDYSVKKLREAKNKSRYQFSVEDRLKFLKLCQMRMWGLKRKIINNESEGE